MRRREFIAGLTGATVAWPLAAHAQQRGMPVIGILIAGAPEQPIQKKSLAAVIEGLGETGYVEGRNVAIEYRYARNDLDRLPQLAAELVRRRVAVLVTGTDVTALAAKEATKLMPIVFAVSGDPVEMGLVTSLNHPGI